MSDDTPSVDCPHCGHKHTRLATFGIDMNDADGWEHHINDACASCGKPFHIQYSVHVDIQTFTEVPKRLREIIEEHDAKRTAGATIGATEK